MNTSIALIGGSGLTRLEALSIERQRVVVTPYGAPSAPLTYGHIGNMPVVFLPRHGQGHIIPPHEVNYRANIWALHSVGIKQIIAVASVGAITCQPGSLCVPDQIIDYTWGREQTFVEYGRTPVNHVDFTEPYDQNTRQQLLAAGEAAGLSVGDGGTYGATQGPRLETAAEIRRMEQDGCDIVGMTGMPEAALAREKGLHYAHLCLAVNWAAGKTPGPVTMEEINTHLNTGMQEIQKLLHQLGNQGRKSMA